MHPAFSVIFLTTLIGAGQGLFLALFTGQFYSLVNLIPAQDSASFYALGSFIVLVLLGLGLFASFFHLGHPERAWRAIAKWRTSWLSREVIALPAFMFLVFIYGISHYFGWNEAIFVLGDNSPESLDSREFGPVPLDSVLGLPAAVVWPPSAWRRLRGPVQGAR